MNYLQARQREVEGRWDYTCMNDGRIWPVGYCAGWRDWTDAQREQFGAAFVERAEAESAPFRDKYHRDGHATRDEAYACYTTYMLDQRTRLDQIREDDAHPRCAAEGCVRLSSATVSIGGWPRFSVCSAHQTRETLESLYHAGDSWES